LRGGAGVRHPGQYNPDKKENRVRDDHKLDRAIERIDCTELRRGSLRDSHSTSFLTPFAQRLFEPPTFPADLFLSFG